MKIKPRKRLFIGLLFTLEITLAVGVFLLWYIPSLGHENFGKGFSVFMGWVLGTLLTVFTLGILFLVAVIVRGREVPGARKLRGVLIRFLLPVITVLGGYFNIPKDDIRRSFVEINNELVRSSSFKAPPKRILVLMPHCIQRDICPHRITVKVSNCRQCGRCDFSELTQTAERFGVDMTVATGGTLARRVIVETRPELIVAVACERDLSSGIVETYPIPVFGVLIDRPEGPCMNTRVNVELVNRALETFLHRESRTFERKTEKEPSS